MRQNIKQKKDHNERKDFERMKIKLSRYNRILSFIIACKNLHLQSLECLLESDLLMQYWTKKDFYAMLHFISNHAKIWDFAIPVLLQSNVAKRWFYAENEQNKADVFYRLQRQFSVKILLDEMFHSFQEQLTKPPYSVAFFISFSSQEFIDEKIPELFQLRDCLNNIIQFDFTMINEEIHYFPELKDEISRRFDHVTTYKLLLEKYCSMIEQYVKDTYKIN